MRTDNKSLGSFGNNRCLGWGFVGLLCGVLLGVLVNLNRSGAENPGSCTLEYDNNRDGKADVILYYERGVLVRAEHDRNFDGRLDYFEWFDDGIISRAESDDDFDGKIDGWLTYRDGSLWLSKHDTDKNGVSDVFQHFEHGVIKMAVWRPNESRKPTRIEFFEKGVKSKVLRDTGSDGLLDTVAVFDAFENQVSEEKLSGPLTAEDAIRAVPHKR